MYHSYPVRVGYIELGVSGVIKIVGQLVGNEPRKLKNLREFSTIGIRYSLSGFRHIVWCVPSSDVRVPIFRSHIPFYNCSTSNSHTLLYMQFAHSVAGRFHRITLQVLIAEVVS